MHNVKPLPSYFHYLSFCLLLTPQHILRLHVCLSFGGLLSPDLPDVMQVSIEAPYTFSHLCICRLFLDLPPLSSVEPHLLHRPHPLFSPTSPSPVLFGQVPVCLGLLFTISFSQQHVRLCFGPAVSCLLLLYTRTQTRAHTHTYTSVYVPMTVRRSR